MRVIKASTNLNANRNTEIEELLILEEFINKNELSKSSHEVPAILKRNPNVIQIFRI
jgi:hypothetical protein